MQWDHFIDAVGVRSFEFPKFQGFKFRFQVSSGWRNGQAYSSGLADASGCRILKNPCNLFLVATEVFIFIFRQNYAPDGKIPATNSG